jgi:hypothetical protein
LPALPWRWLISLINAAVLGQGSTFRVVLPIHVDEMMEAA